MPNASAWAADAFPGNLITGNSGSFVDSNTASTGDAGEPATFGGGTLNTNWYNWTAPATGTVTFQTCSATQTTFDTTLFGYSGTVITALTLASSNDDACANTTPQAYASLISFPTVSGTNYKIQVDGYGSATGTYLFTYNFVPPTVTIANTTNGTEAGPTNGVVTVTQSGISATPTVIAYSVGGTATSGSDFTALSGTVTIPAGSTTATITIPVINDLIVEPAETVTVTLTSITSGVATLGATVLATNTITSNDTATVSIVTTTNGIETGPTNGVATLTQTAVSATNTVLNYSVGGTATSGTDFTALSGTVTIPAGSTTATITIPVIDDAVAEAAETVIITLTSVSSGLATLGAPLAATNTISDNDGAFVSIANTTNGNEAGAIAGVMTVTQTATRVANTVIAYSVSGTATSGLDFTALTGTVTIPAGSTTATISIPTIDDLIVEGNETVVVTLTSVTSGLASLGSPLVATNTIADNDAATVSIANTTTGMEAGPTAGTMTVTQTLASATNTVIAYAVSGTATSGTDFTALSGTVTVLAGATTATISIPVLDDAILEGGETVTVTLTSISSGLATLGSPLAATNTITDNDSATVSIANTTNGAEAGPTSAVLTVTQTAVSATNTVLAYSVSGTAIAGTDFTAPSGTVTIPAGSTSATITVAILNDAITEPSDSLIITLTSVTSGLATLGSPLAATNTIADNDPATVSIANTTNGAEAGPAAAVLTVTQTAVSSTDTVLAYSLSGTAIAGTDFTSPSGTVTILAGSTTATISITILNDAIVEPSDSLIVTLTSVSSGLATLGSPVAATNTIADNDAATVSIANTINGAEVGPTTAVLTVTQTAVSSTNTVLAYSLSGTAISGTDFTAPSGSVTIPAGSTTATISITILNDAIVEPSDTLIVTLTSVSSGLATLGTPVAATNTIADNDSATVSIANTVNGAEAGPTTGTMTITQSAVSSTDTEISIIFGGTATLGLDYNPAISGTITIPAGSTSVTLSLPIFDDAVLDPNETIVATLTGITSGLATLGSPTAATNTIADNEAATVSITNTTQSAEPSTFGVMTISQTLASPTNTVITYSVGGTATSGSDYTALTGTATILAGSTSVGILIGTQDDAIVEPGETVIVTLTAVTSGYPTLGSPVSATNTISDNDSATVSIANISNSAEPSTNGILTVTQSAVSSVATVLNYAVGGTATAGSDYTALSGTVTIAAGSTTANISIPVINDSTIELSETVAVTLTSVASGLATLGSPLIATNTIVDDDLATVSIANTSGSSEAGPVNGVMTVTQSAISPTNTILAYTVSGTATSGSDFTALSGTVTIVAGSTTATIPITITNDAIVETAETIIFSLTSVTSGLATLGSPTSATNTITDNDSATVSIANTTNGAETGPVAGVMTVTQTAVSATNTVIAYTVGGTATSGSDFTALTGTVTITAGATTATISIPVIDDSAIEVSETVSITLTSISSGLASLGSPLLATNTIVDDDLATVSIANTSGSSEAGPVNGVMTVTQSAISPTNTVIAYSVAGSATSGSDFTALSGSVTILAGATSATIPITITNDAIVETPETIAITLSSVTSGLAILGSPTSATNTITDNDSATVSIANTTNGTETGPVNGVMTVTQTATAATDTVIAYSVSGTATSGSDYTALSGTVTIIAGATTASITIPVINDTTIELSETVIITLTSISSGLATLGSPLVATNTIADNDLATVTIANTTLGAEGGSNAVLTVTQSAISPTNTVLTYSMTGTATSGLDYTAPTGTVTIPAGSTTATITILVTDDLILEPSETAIVTLDSVSSGLAVLGSPSAASTSISDNDSATVSIASTTTGAEAGPIAAVFTVTMTKASSTATVLAYGTSGTAIAGTDFTAPSGSVTIPAGSTSATITITILNDLVVEPTDTLIITLSSISSGHPSISIGAPASATNNITDNDSATVSIASTTNGAEAGPTAAVFTVTQTAVSSTNTILAYTVSGSAITGTDFTAPSGSVTIAAGSTTATISVTILNDAIVETSDSLTITLTSVSSGLATLGTPLAATNTIADDDTATVSIANTTNGAEAGPVAAVLTVTQTAASSTDTVLAYSLSGTAIAGTDYTAPSGTVTIVAGSTSATINVSILNDLIVEPSDSLTVTLTSISSGLATLGSPVAATNTIADNDTATVSIANTTNGAEPATNGLMTVTLTAVSSTNTVIAYSVSGTATSGADYTTLSGSVTVVAGATTATITIPILDDLIVDPAETIVVTLTAISSGLPTLGTPVTATNTISDNDVAAFTIAKAVDQSNIAAPGTLTYTITIASAGNVPLTAPSLSDTLANSGPLLLSTGPTLISGDVAPLGILNAGETWVYSATYAVTQNDIDNGSAITNSAIFDTAETAPQGSSTVSTFITQTPSLIITKSASPTAGVVAGQSITYTYTVENNGNVTISNISLADTHNAAGPPPSPASEVISTDASPINDSSDSNSTDAVWDELAPDDIITFTGTYVIQQSDVDTLQ